MIVTDPDRNIRIQAHHRLEKRREEKRQKIIIGIKLSIATITLLGGSVFSLLMSILWCHNGPIISSTPSTTPAARQAKKFTQALPVPEETKPEERMFRDMIGHIDNKRTTKNIARTRYVVFDPPLDPDDRLGK